MVHRVLFGANRDVRCLAVAAMGLMALVGGQANAQSGGEPGSDVPAAIAAQPVNPVRSQLEVDGRYHADAVAGVEQRPSHPPFEQLEVMMPQMGWMPQEVALDQRLMVFEPATGRLDEMPLEGVTSAAGVAVTAASRGAASMEVVGYGDRGFGSLSLVPQGSRGLFPNSTACRIVVQFIDHSGISRFFTCSGTMVDSGVVLTAGHCVFSRDPSIMDWAVQAWVYPGWNATADIGNEGHANPIGEFGYAMAGQLLTASEYYNSGDQSRDLGMIVLARGTSRSVGMLSGWVATSYGVCAPASGWWNTSYPSESCGGGLHNGLGMYRWAGTVDACPTIFNNRYYLTTTPGCLTAMWGGMDGSALIAAGTNTAYGVLSESNRSTQAGASALTTGFLNGLQNIATAQRGSTLDIEPLRCRMTAPTARAGEDSSSFSMYVVNATNANPVSRLYTVRAYLSDDSDINAGDTLLGTFDFELDFAPMSGVLFIMPPVRIPSNTPAGPKWLGCIFEPGTDAQPLNDDTDGFDAAPITILACQAPAKPASVDASVSACTDVYVSWAQVGNADAYRLHRAQVNDFGASTVVYEGEYAGTVDVAPPVNTDLYYWVTAFNACGESLQTEPRMLRVEPDEPPSDLIATDATRCGAVELSWTNSPDTQMVALYRSTDAAGSNLIFLATATGSTYTDFSAVPWVKYHYWMYGYGSCGWGPIVYGDKGTAAGLPEPVTTVFASDGGSCAGIQVSWTPAAGAEFYAVYRSFGPVPAPSPSLVNITSQLHLSDLGVPPGTVFTYQVVAYNVCGAPGFVGSHDSGTAGDATAAQGPSGVAATETRCDGVEVSWINNGSFSYSIYRERIDLPGSRTLMAVVSSSPWLDETAELGVEYTYTVSGYNACGDSLTSFFDSGSRSSLPPAAPTGLVAAPGSDCQQVDLSWNPVPGASDYLVLRSDVADFSSGTLVGIATGPAFTDAVAGMGRVYYRLVARTSCGSSEAGSIATALPFGAVDIYSIPAQVIVNEGEEVFIRITDSGAFSYLWYGPSGFLGDGGRFFGTHSSLLHISAAQPGDAGLYYCDLSKPCGILRSPTVELIVNSAAPCPADFNQDGGVDGSDIDAFFIAWEAGEMTADVNQDGGVDGSDIDVFFFAWENGGC